MQAFACSGDGSVPLAGKASQVPADTETALSIRTAEREMRDGNLADAGRLLDEVLGEAPESPELWVAIARLRFRGGEHLSAIDAADRALELGPQYAPALLMRGQLVRDSNGLIESLPWFDAAVQADPRNVEALGEYAATLGDIGRNLDMLEVLASLSRVDRENAQGLYIRAVLAARAGEPVLARSLLDRSGWREAGIPSAMLLDGLIDLAQGNADTAIETFAELIEKQPANRRLRDLYARALWEAGRDEKLIVNLTPSIEGGDASPYITMLVGRAHERLGDRQKAARLLKSAYQASSSARLALSPTGVLGNALQSRTAQVRSAIRSENPAEAASMAAQLKRQFPQSADVLVLAGDVAMANGDADEALSNYSSSARVRRPWPLTRKLIAASLETGEDQVAQTLLSRYTLSDPRNADAITALVQQAQASEEWNRVMALADYAMALGSGQDPEVLTAQLEAARATSDQTAIERYQSLLDAVRPPKLVRE